MFHILDVYDHYRSRARRPAAWFTGSKVGCQGRQARYLAQ